MTAVAVRERRSQTSVLGRYVVGLLVAGMAATALGMVAHTIPRHSVWYLFAAIPALLVVGFVVASGPRACLVMLVATSILGLNMHSIGGAEYGIRVFDVFWIALVGWTLLIRTREGPILGHEVGQRQAGIWLAALLVSLYSVAVYSSSEFGHSFVAWARLAETISLVWLVPYALRKIEDVELVLLVIEVSVAVALLFAMAQSAVNGDLGSRLGGAHGPDSTGLLAAVLIAASIHAPVPRHRGLRGLLLVVGVAGLLMTKSVGSLTAAGVMLGIFGFRSWGKPGGSPHRALLTPGRLVLLVLATLAVVAAVRPGALPTSKHFDSSTTLARTVFAAGGLELFRDNPIVGVGWSRGGSEVASDKIDRQLRDFFGESIRPDFLPKQLGGVSSLHNSYIEMLAEAGIVGFAAFVALVVVGVRGIRTLLRTVAGDPRASACAWCAVILLVGVLVWWNDNALFGVQPETVLAATLLGVLAAIPRSRDTAQATSRTQVGQGIATL